MATAYLDYMRQCDSLHVGPLVFTRFETNPGEPPDSRLCWSNRVGYYLASIDNEFEWKRDPHRDSTQLVVMSDAEGHVFLVETFEGEEQAEKFMRKSRKAGVEVGEWPNDTDSDHPSSQTAADTDSEHQG